MHPKDALWRKSNLGRHLFAASDRFLRDKMAGMVAGGYPQVTEALLTLFVSSDEAGTRITDIALNAGLTKQSVVEIVNRAQRAGWCLRDLDPLDKRLRILRLTDSGQALLARLRLSVTAAEQALQDCVGAEFLGDFKRSFGAYSALPVEDLGIVGVVGGDKGPRGDAAWRSGNAGRVLALASRRFAREALGLIHRDGFRDVGEALITLLRNLDLAGTRLTELAARARMTKQSMRELVDRAQALDLVARVSDPLDARAKTIAFTPRGLAMLAAFGQAIAITESAAEQAVGAAFVARTKAALRVYAGPPDLDP